MFMKHAFSGHRRCVFDASVCTDQGCLQCTSLYATLVARTGAIQCERTHWHTHADTHQRMNARRRISKPARWCACTDIKWSECTEFYTHRRLAPAACLQGTQEYYAILLHRLQIMRHLTIIAPFALWLYFIGEKMFRSIVKRLDDLDFLCRCCHTKQRRAYSHQASLLFLLRTK